MDFYAVLGIPSNADRNTIRNAYLRLVRRYHPDRGHGSSSEKFRQVTEAYETLADAARRSSYDLEFHRSQRPHSAPVEPVIRPQFVYQERPEVFGVVRSAPDPRSQSVSHELEELLNRLAQMW